MSLFLYPTAAASLDTSMRRDNHQYGRFVFGEEPALVHQSTRCAPFAHSHYHAPVHRSFASQYVMADDDDDDNDSAMDIDLQGFAAAIHRQRQQQAIYERQVAARRRQQQQIERQQYLARQRQLEEQRRLEQQQRQRQQEEAERQAVLAMANAAASAWAAQIEEHQRRQAEHARRVTLARQQQQQQRQVQLEAERKAQQARKTAYLAQKQALQQQQTQHVGWEEQMRELATHGVSSLIDFAGQLFAGLEEADEEASAPKNESSQEAGPSQVRLETGNADEKAHPTSAVKTPNDNVVYEDPAEVAPTPVEPTTKDDQDDTAAVETAAATSSSPQAVEESQSQEQLVFTYPLPADAALRTSVSASDIDVSYDASSHAITVKGLWPTQAYPADAQPQHSEARGRKRTRSPKRPRVSDVDEATGEEISAVANDGENKDDDDDDDFEHVEVASSASSSTSGTRTQTQASHLEPVQVALPANADVSRLRADLTDEGLQIWV